MASVEYNLGTLAADAKHFEQTVESYQESVRLLEALARRFPGSPAYRMKLALSQVALAKALGETTPTEAEKSLRKALDEQSALLKEYPEVPEYQIDVGRGHFQLGLLLMKTNPAAAIPEAETARSFHRDVLKTRPESEQVLAFLLEDQLLLAQALIAAGRLPEAMDAAEDLPSIHPSEPRFYINAAALLIQCAVAAPETEDGRKQSERCLARAVGVLRKAVQAKVISSKGTLDLKDLAPLKNRDDFKRLRDSLDDTVHIG